MIYLDSETTGLTGPMVLLQYAVDDGEINLYEVFNKPLSETIDLIKFIFDHPALCIFNASFDIFHLNKIYNIFWVLYKHGYGGIPPVEYVAAIEKLNPSEWCLRPQSTVDPMLWARKGKYQSTMSRSPILIRDIPDQIIGEVKKELTERVRLPEIYFIKSKTGYEWEILPTEREGFSNLVLRFSSSTSLRALAFDLLGEDKADWPIPSELNFEEFSWRPYGWNWQEVIYRHIITWEKNEQARYYAWKDVDLLRKIYKVFLENGEIEPGDVDSELAAAVGAARWKGFATDTNKIEEQIEKYTPIAKSAPIAPAATLSYLKSKCSNNEQRAVITSTNKAMLSSIVNWGGDISEAASSVIAARSADKRLDILNKLKAMDGKFHPDFTIIGTRSNRMSGGSDQGASINPQGIPREKDFRSIFLMAYPDEILEGGDAQSFEVTIMDAIFKDPNLHAQLKAGKKFHGLAGAEFFNMEYDDLIKDEDKYNRSKVTVFAWAYGAQEHKAAETLGKDVEDARLSLERLSERYPGIKQERERIYNDFCSMRQPGGIGTAVYWHDPCEYIESIFGFRRYFTLENSICKILFNLAQEPPRHWRNYSDIRVKRRDRFQSLGGACQSALFASAFGIQQANLRQAGNHIIQSPGATITKQCQYNLWDQQPRGIYHWVIRTFQIHDELLSSSNKSVNTKDIMMTSIEYFRKWIPLLAWDWEPLPYWKK